MRKFNYKEYQAFFNELVEKGTSTGENPNDDIIRFTKLNFSRSKRINKKFEPISETEEFIASLKKPLKFLLITEPWCGDAAQIVPAIAEIAALSDLIELEVVLRDENEELMGRYLTNGGKAIPIVVFIDENGNEIGHWGPRPQEAQKMVTNYKALPEEERPDYLDFVQQVQAWYNDDKTVSIQKEFVDALKEKI